MAIAYLRETDSGYIVTYHADRNASAHLVERFEREDEAQASLGYGRWEQVDRRNPDGTSPGNALFWAKV